MTFLSLKVISNYIFILEIIVFKLAGLSLITLPKINRTGTQDPSQLTLIENFSKNYGLGMRSCSTPSRKTEFS